MSDNYRFCFEEVIGHEGGFTDRRSDPGNWTGGRIGRGKPRGTKYGISAASYPRLDIKNLTLKQAEDIYYVDYYEPSGASLCSAGLDLAVFDAAVNTGVSRAKRWLQIAVGTKADGVIGPNTQLAIAKAVRDRPLETLQEFMAQRTWHHMKLDSMDDEYGLGWSRRLIDVSITAAERMKKG